MREGLRAPEIGETHTGLVVLVGDRAYKAKKSVVTEFLDFSTVERREEVCQREVRLNGRLSADSYLGVAHFADPESDEPEPVVVMRRYSDSVRLVSMVRRGEPVEHHLSAIAEKLASFHAMAARGPNIADACGTVAAVQARWRQNVAELNHFATGFVDPAVVAEIDRLAGQYVDGRAGLFARRIVELRGRRSWRSDRRRRLLPGDGSGSCWTAWSSTIGFGSSTGSTTPPSWQWTWSFSEARPSPSSSSANTGALPAIRPRCRWRTSTLRTERWSAPRSTASG